MGTNEKAKEDGETAEIKKIAVVGAGVMGQEIIRVFAQNGFKVVFYDIKEGQADAALSEIVRRLTKEKEKGRISEEDFSLIIKSINKAETLEEMKSVDLVIEAIYEDFNVKAEIFRQLDKICPPKVIFLTNTSSLSIRQLAGTTKRPDRFMGMHFMNPPTLIPLIELIRGSASQRTFDKVLEISKKTNRVVIESFDDVGFIINRIMLTAIREAIQLVELGTGSIEDVNKAVLMGVGTGKAMPILELADLIGLDICLNILRTFERELGKEYKPPRLLEKMVEDGKLGRKTGQGFFKYEKK